jgi:hypothetical protein
MGLSNTAERRAAWLSYFPANGWLANDQRAWLPHDLVAGITLAAYAIPGTDSYSDLARHPENEQLPTVLALPAACRRSAQCSKAPSRCLLLPA